MYLSGRLSNVLGSTCCLRALYSTVKILMNVLDFLYLIYIRGEIELIRMRGEILRDLFRERLTLNIALYQDYLIVLLFDCRF